MASDLRIEFAQIMLAHALAVASPGPDFALVLRQSVAAGRRTALWTSVGIGSGILVHVTYSLLGLGLLLQRSVTAFTVLKYVGAAYLAWLGVQALRAARPRSAEAVESALSGVTPPRDGAAWTTGFLTNVLNPKATLFFVALFPTVVSVHTPLAAQVGYGVWMSLATMGWFSLVSCVFTRPATRRVFLRWSHWIDRALGMVFIGFAIGLIVAAV